MYHSVIFGDKNSWTDWHLVPKCRPVMASPGVKTNFTDIPGGSGSLDETEILDNEVHYSDRQGSWDFYIENDYNDFHYIFSDILNYLHGQKMECRLEDEPGVYYIARFSVEYSGEENYRSTLTISYIAEPARYEESG